MELASSTVGLTESNDGIGICASWASLDRAVSNTEAKVGITAKTADVVGTGAA
jgi:hypothetical protein